ncbi:hypothetical protein AN958_04110 [Leucoagaricus sp. SymC.cos]|nr:hypothetical protein AN958_04110 [Leucoagaricus sp. SymC.cos]
MTSLPPRVHQRLQDVAHVVSAYDICLRLEKSLQLAANKGDDVGNNLIFIRILGYLIHYAPTDQGLKTVVEEISSCIDDSALLLFGKMYYDHYIRAFRANKGRIPTPLNYASRPSFDTITDMINNTWVDAPQSHSDAKKNVGLALIRDGYCCVVTGRFDERSVLEIQELKERVISDSSLRTEVTECAHIFAESTNADIGPNTAKRNYAATMWALMHRFGYDELPDDLNGAKVHRLENVMTLVPGFHMYFDQLLVWFVATNEKNKYKLEATEAFLLRGYPEYVTFTTPDQARLPVPSPTYLAIHAACAKVAHLSGAAKCIDKFYRDMDDSKTLDTDGASAAMLEHAIFELQACGYETTV